MKLQIEEGQKNKEAEVIQIVMICFFKCKDSNKELAKNIQFK